MKLTSRVIIPALIGAASAASAPEAKVFLFQGQQWPSTSNPPTLSPEEARLVFAQRLGVSQYHGIGDASDNALEHISTFGGNQNSIFQDSGRDKTAELVLFILGGSSKSIESIFSSRSSLDLAFTIPNPPASTSNRRFIKDLQRQVGQGKTCDLEDDINPFNDRCWGGKKAKAISMSIEAGHDSAINALKAVQNRIVKFAANNEMNVMVVLVPTSGSGKSSYGSYEMPTQVPIGRRQAEEPMTNLPAASSIAFNSKQVKTSNTSSEPITGVPPVCHSSLDLCTSSTNNCSGHGECYLKYRPTSDEDKTQDCYTCGCVPTVEYPPGGKDPSRITYWGGAACQKKDVSGPFWLFAIFTVVMIGLVSWSIGLLFSVGEEKLPGVIGAGVPSKTR